MKKKITLNEQVNRIKSIMGINENDESIRPDVMKRLEMEADKIFAEYQEKRKENEDFIKDLEDAIKDENISDSVKKFLWNDLNRAYDIKKHDYRSSKESILRGLIDFYKQEEREQNYKLSRIEKSMNAKFTNEQIINVFVTAIEGGSNYWYYIIDVPKEIKYMVNQEGIPFSEACGKHILNGGSLTIHDAEEVFDNDDDDMTIDPSNSLNKPEPLGTIDMDSLLDAINIIKTQYKEVYENIIMDEYDAGDADVFFQIATMGEVVFG